MSTYAETRGGRGRRGGGRSGGKGWEGEREGGRGRWRRRGLSLVIGDLICRDGIRVGGGGFRPLLSVYVA